MGKHCRHSLLASGQGRGKKIQAKVCVKYESESRRERKKIACVILKKLLLGQFLLATISASPWERVTGPLLALPATFSDLKGSHLHAYFLFLPRKKIKENLESWSLKNLGQVFNELRRPCFGGLEMAAVTLGLAPLVTP